METKLEKKAEISIPPPHGWISELAKLCDCSRNTVRTAIYNKAKGVKADFVRKTFSLKYGNINSMNR